MISIRRSFKTFIILFFHFIQIWLYTFCYSRIQSILLVTSLHFNFNILSFFREFFYNTFKIFHMPFFMFFYCIMVFLRSNISVRKNKTNIHNIIINTSKTHLKCCPHSHPNFLIFAVLNDACFL